MNITLNRSYILIMFLLFAQSCAYYSVYEVDNGNKYMDKGRKYRYSNIFIESSSFEIKIHTGNSKVEDNGYLTIASLAYFPKELKSSFNPNKKVSIISMIPFFKNTTILEKKYIYDAHFNTVRERYTCNNFSKMVKRNKYLYLKVTYDTDSLGFVGHHVKEYILTRKRYYYMSLH